MHRNMSAFRPSPTPAPPSRLPPCPQLTPTRPVFHCSSNPAHPSSPKPQSHQGQSHSAKPPFSKSSPRRSRSPQSQIHSHPNPRRHNAAIIRHAKSGNLKALSDAVRKARADNFVLNAVNYTTIINAHIIHGHPQDALSWLADMRAEGVPPTNATLRIAIKISDSLSPGRAAIRVITQTFAWVRSASTEPPETRTWNMIMAALIRLGAKSEAVSILGAMRKAEKHAPRPTACSFNHCITALGRAHRFREALSLFADMACRPSPAAPDVVSFNSILDAALSSGSGIPLGPPHVSDCDFAAAVETAMARRGILPNVKTDTLIIRLLSRGLANRKDDGSGNGSYNELDKLLLQDVYKRMQNAVKADSSLREIRGELDKPFFDAAITAFAMCGSVRGMADSMDAMISRGIEVDALTVRAVLSGGGRNSDNDLAVIAVKTLHDAGVRVPDGVYAAALQTLHEAPSAALSILSDAEQRGMRFTVPMMCGALSACGNDAEAALRVWQQGLNDGLCAQPEVLAALGRVCGRAARPEFALKVVYAARRIGAAEMRFSQGRAFVAGFARGTADDDGSADNKVRSNLLKAQYARLLQVECGALNVDASQWPLYRIRIRL